MAQHANCELATSPVSSQASFQGLGLGLGLVMLVMEKGKPKVKSVVRFDGRVNYSCEDSQMGMNEMCLDF
jgi:hypothetical protein